jgi:hypothetical protein
VAGEHRFEGAGRVIRFEADDVNRLAAGLAVVGDNRGGQRAHTDLDEDDVGSGEPQ